MYSIILSQLEWKWNMKTDYFFAKATMSHTHCCHQYLDSNDFKIKKLNSDKILSVRNQFSPMMICLEILQLPKSMDSMSQFWSELIILCWADQFGE